MDLQRIIVQPSTSHTHTVVFLHGRADTALGFSRSLQYSLDSHKRTLVEIFPSFRWVFPSARIQPCAAFPKDRLSQWFDIWNVQNFTEREELQAEGLKDSVASIRQILESEATLLQGRWDHIILAGISQGAATSTHTLLNLNIPRSGPATAAQRRLGAFLGFSCRMPFPGRSLGDTRQVLQLGNSPEDDDIIRNTPILLQHCVDDGIVLIKNGRNLRDTLRLFGAQVSWTEYPDGGHWFNSPRGIDDAVAFLQNALGLNVTNATPAKDSDAIGLF